MITKDVCVITEKYTNNTGKEVSRYQNVGVAFVHDDGRMSIKLAKWFNPAGIVADDCYLYLFDKKDSTKSAHHEQRATVPIESDIPF